MEAHPAIGAHPVPATSAGTASPEPARLLGGLATSAAAVIALQRLAGNGAVTRVMKSGRIVFQGQSPPVGAEDVHTRIRKAIEHHDYLSIPPDSELGAATDEERVQLSALCISGGFYAPEQAAQRVFTLWADMGDRMTAIAGSHQAEWEAATKFTPWLMDIMFVTTAQNDFHSAVRSLAEAHIGENQRYIEDRTKALGLDGSEPLTPQQQADFRHAIQDNAYHAYELRHDQAKLRTLVVGYEDQDLGFGEHESKFHPGHPPKHRATLFSTPPADWDQAKQIWDDAENQLAAIGNDYPELYAAGAADDQGAALLELSRVIPERFGENVKQHLLKLRDRIREIQDMITTGKLELLDLDLLTQAVLKGEQATGGRDWTKGFDQWAAKRVLADHQGDKAAIRAILQTIEVTALVVGTFAGGIGRLLAAGATVGLEAFQAGQAAIEGNRLEKAATATPLTGTALVSKAQADAKKSEAIAHMVRAVVTALLTGGPALKDLRTLRLKGLVQDEGLLVKLRGDVQNDALLEKLLRTRCSDPIRLSRLLDRVNAQQLDELLAGITEQDLPKLEEILAILGEGKPGSIAFNIGGELETKAGEVVINPGRLAMSIEKLRTLRPDNLVVEARAERIPFPDGCGKSIVGNKLPNSINWTTAAKEFNRVLAPGSKLEATVFGSPGSGEPLRKALADQGFIVKPPLKLPNGPVIGDNSIQAIRL